MYLETLVWRMVVVVVHGKMSAFSNRSSTKCQQKSCKIFFFYFEVLRQPPEYQKIVKLDWNKTSEQGHIAQKNFQPDLWDLCPSHSWRGESNSQPKKIAKKLTWWVNLIVIQSWRLQHDIRLPLQVSRVSLQKVLTSIIPEIKKWVPWSKFFFVKYEDARAPIKKTQVT